VFSTHTHTHTHKHAVCVCQTLALAVPVWGGPLVLANSVWSYLLCFMFLASRGHKQPFVAKRWLVSLQTDPCSCSPLLDISVCVCVCVCVSVCACLSLLRSVSVCGDVCVCSSQYIIASIAQQSLFDLILGIWSSHSLHSHSQSFPLSDGEWSDCRMGTGRL